MVYLDIFTLQIDGESCFRDFEMHYQLLRQYFQQTGECNLAFVYLRQLQYHFT